MLSRSSLGVAAFAMSVVALVVVGACGDDPAGMSATNDAGNPSAVLEESLCPDAAPEGGEGCVVPEGTTCAFGACGSSVAQCAAGAWRYAGNPPPRPPCPTDFPASESACPPCWPAGVTCVYGSRDCDAPDASEKFTIASCPSGRWTLDSFPCASLTDGGKDAGADVQGDADADAD